MKIVNTSDPSLRPPVIMLVYGNSGVGKTTFCSTAPKPLMADCEGGSKYFGLRSISMDVAHIEKWSDMKDFYDAAKSGGYETIIIDPIGELMGKLKRFMVAQGDRKLIQSDGSPSMAGWGWLKQTMRDYLRMCRDSNLNVLIVAHVDEQKDEDRMVKRPLLETKVWVEMVNMVDVVGYMAVIGVGEESKRVIFVDPTSDAFIAKDRTGQLGKIIEPDFTKIIAACQGTEKYSWSSEAAKAKGKATPVVKEEKKIPSVLPQ